MEAVRWLALGPLTAPDERLPWAAAEGGHVLLTHDQDMGPRLLAVLKGLEEDLLAGALVVEDRGVRRLPLG